MSKNTPKTLTFRAKVIDTKATAIIETHKVKSPVATIQIRNGKNGANHHSIMVSGLISGNYSLSIVDLTGKMYYTKKVSISGDRVTQVPIESALPAGVYCGVVKDSGGEVTRLLMQ